jgi:hypothetical protein
MTRAELAAMGTAGRLRRAREIPPGLHREWRDMAEDTYQRMTASECNAADNCVMDPGCPFVDGCVAAEAAGP